MYSNDDDEEGDEGKVDDGVDKDGHGAGVEVAELHKMVASGELEEQTRREEDEQHHSDHNGAPVRHPPPFSSSSLFSVVGSLFLCPPENWRTNNATPGLLLYIVIL